VDRVCEFGRAMERLERKRCRSGSEKKVASNVVHYLLLFTEK
jgi:hypothetical protein